MKNDYISACSEYTNNSSEQPTDMDSICKELDLQAFNGNIDRLNELLDNNQSKIPKKSLNSALRAAIKGCNTQKLEDSIMCLDILI